MKIITGMHRSGTSLVARLFYEAGANMGDPEAFYRPDEWNPDGYYEQPDIHSINMPLINGPYWKFAYFLLPSTQTIMSRAVRMQDDIRTLAQKYDDAVVKETRFCLTLPAWLEYGLQVDRVLVCLREPMQAARSIQKRNHTLIRHGLWLWRVHNERLLQNIPDDTPVWYINYHRLLDTTTYVDELSRAYQFMGVNVSEARVRELLQQCVKPKMNHNRDVVPEYPERIQKLWDDLMTRYHQQSLDN